MTLASDEAYRQAGVDLQRAARVVDIAKHAAGQTLNASILSTIGGFSGAFELPAGYRQPVLLTGCDGVGTKLKLAFALNQHHTVGIDLVAMSVNDILVNGGRPLVFLDYVATSQINPATLEAILQGITQGCLEAGCALVGGETAEMPGFYPAGEYDLAGFCVGVAEKDGLYPKAVQPGDVLIGLASSGLHSNGYSLVRKILADHPEISFNDTPTGWAKTLGETLLEPTRIYVKPVLKLIETFPDAVRAMVHITGGGFYDNIPRVLSPGLSAELEASSWQLPPVMSYLQELGQLSPETIWHTFNGGIGFVLVTQPQYEQELLAFLAQEVPHWQPVSMGRIVETSGKTEVFVR